ncbi:MAG: hypothetical protein F2534_00165 [Actinobacteria bacterium]|jgi:hypothetical protein|uniref:Unannotated protein n=1 Tax=freshwater metagenome TaxID=449393 RepID=A0A6J6BDA7_9ZZZZ|nr:hypothetical protein [Actinomycetota bacterium]
MSNDQVQGAADADAPPEFKLPTLPSVPRLPTAPRSSEPLPTVPMLSLDDPAGGRSGTATSFQEMLRAHQAQATTSRRRRRRGSPVATFLLMVIVGGALAGAGYLAYDEYRGRNTIDDRLPTFGEVDVPYASFTLRANIEGIDLDATTEAIPGAPAPRPLVMDYTITGGRGSNAYDLAGTITDPNDPLGNEPFRGIVDKRGLFVEAPDGTWVLFTQPGREMFEVVSRLGQLLTWDVLVPEEMLPFVEVESTSTYTTENGRMTTYDLVLDLHGFATEDERGFERWRDDTGFTGDTDVDDFARSGYPISITVDDDGLVWGYTESNAISTTEMRLERVSTEPYAPTVPATWTEDATPIL